MGWATADTSRATYVTPSRPTAARNFGQWYLPYAAGTASGVGATVNDASSIASTSARLVESVTVIRVGPTRKRHHELGLVDGVGEVAPHGDQCRHAGRPHY